jgi:hypothetical protein
MSKRGCDSDVGKDQGVPQLRHELRSAPCQGPPMQATASALRTCTYRRQRQRMSPHENGVGRAPEGNGVSRRPFFRCARRRGVWEVRSRLASILYKSQKKSHQLCLLPARPHDRYKQNKKQKKGWCRASQQPRSRLRSSSNFHKRDYCSCTRPRCHSAV